MRRNHQNHQNHQNHREPEPESEPESEPEVGIKSTRKVTIINTSNNRKMGREER